MPITLPGTCSNIVSNLKLRLQQAERQHEADLDEIRKTQQQELQQVQDRIEARLKTETSFYQNLLTNADLISGKLARVRHNEEWDRRLRHDPAFAASPLERTLLEVERVGRDPGIAARQALEQVIRMVAPPESTNKIIADGDKFSIELAFKISALSPHEQGAWTRHASLEEMKQETVLMCAQVMRDLFDSCGWRGIRKIQISANHAVRHSDAAPEVAGPEQPLPVTEAPVDWDVVYRCSISEAAAAQVASWRLLPLHKIAALMTVETDGFQKLSINREPAGASPRLDPAGPLKF